MDKLQPEVKEVIKNTIIEYMNLPGYIHPFSDQAKTEGKRFTYGSKQILNILIKKDEITSILGLSDEVVYADLADSKVSIFEKEVLSSYLSLISKRN